MSLTAQIASSADSFKLSQKLVSSLAEKFGFKFEDGWAVVSSRSVENVQKRLKREKKRSNPAALVKHPRTAFSFFTQKQRPIEAKAHPDASFGQLSGFVAAAWKSLSASDLQKYKDMETADKARYQTERDAALANAPAVATEAPAVASAPVVAEPKPKAKKAPKAKASAPAVATEAAAPVVPAATPAKAGKATKAKVATPAAAPAPVASTPAVAPAAAAPVAVAAAAAPVAAAAPAKATKAKAATPAPATTPAKASGKKAGKQ